MADEIIEQSGVSNDTPIVETNTSSMVDKQAYNELVSEITKLNAGLGEVRAKSEEDYQKLGKVRSALMGDDETSHKEKFVEDFVKDPESVIKRIQKETIDNEVNPLKKQLKDRSLSDADDKAISFLKATDSNFDNVVAAMEQYTSADFKKYEESPDRFELLYSLTKTRMDRDVNRKAAQTKAVGEAKQVSNVTAVSAQPNVVLTSEPESPNQRFYNEVGTLRSEFKSDEVLDKWTDVFFDESNPQGFWSKHSKD